MVARVAVYYAPEPDDPLHAAATAWLGRDAGTGAALAQPDLPDIAAVTADPRGYGFHATLKPPFRLATGYDAFLDEVRRWAATAAPFALPPLSVQDLKGFLALRETAPCAPLHALADSAVAALDGHRAPPTGDELARRRKAKLSDAHEALLVRWGYPYVMGEWQFHMTLTRRLTPGERDIYRPAAEAHFAGIAAVERKVGAVCVFTQAAPGAPFLIAERIRLGG
ncbi:DUF1045 domain-containing protein [Roseococcus sp. SYP-B2431]|uniref:DUF1045 domain-containing protein n=1 Tax=Roseococcus sp. SYP-B2431 TaxID=2496640 RepID=UPI00103F33E3|nr:DUF1045 domain-containing protein [Roseococcus sp. SYP-B2431]TCI00275.1 DUF1045 domain-containing protein [Roseococcus sp. SYP-B2431]